jgi:hypothetical protein
MSLYLFIEKAPPVSKIDAIIIAQAPPRNKAFSRRAHRIFLSPPPPALDKKPSPARSLPRKDPVVSKKCGACEKNSRKRFTFLK